MTANGWKSPLLGARMEALLALGMAATLGCDGCIEGHVRRALESGSSKDEVAETIEIARHLGGEPSAECCRRAAELVTGS